MTERKIVSRQEWLQARQAHLAKEKELTRLGDQLSEARRELPWVVVNQDYTFDGPDGEVSLGDLFAGHSQLLVYHFMFDPDWEDGCKSCSLVADHYDRIIVHVNQRDAAMVTVSKAPLAKLGAFKQRMGWRFPWVSSYRNDFNRDFGVSFTAEDKERGEVDYNYGRVPFFSSEGPGISVFYRDDAGQIFHTYSSYGRGLDRFIGTYHLLDILPKGRDEADLPYGMAWVRHHDRYE